MTLLAKSLGIPQWKSFRLKNLLPEFVSDFSHLFGKSILEVSEKCWTICWPNHSGREIRDQCLPENQVFTKSTNYKGVVRVGGTSAPVQVPHYDLVLVRGPFSLLDLDNLPFLFAPGFLHFPSPPAPLGIPQEAKPRSSIWGVCYFSGGAAPF